MRISDWSSDVCSSDLLNQYTRYGTVGLTAVQGYFIAVGLEGYGAQSGLQAVVEPGMLFRVAAVVSLIGGTMFLMWLGEQITSRGIGNGVSLIIMRSEEHTSELQSLMRISYAVFCLKKKIQ